MKIWFALVILLTLAIVINSFFSMAGNVGDKIYSSDGNVLDYCLTDTSSLTISILALPGHTNYKPNISINSNPVTLLASLDKPLWTGTYNMIYNFADASITVIHEDGAKWSTIIDADTPAIIQSANFIGGYPGSQTELKSGDTFDVSIMTDVVIVKYINDETNTFFTISKDDYDKNIYVSVNKGKVTVKDITSP